MSRGGKREGAGRKTSWASGVRFEDTSLVRIPNYLKTDLLHLAHRLDSGLKIDSVSKSKEQQIASLQERVAQLEGELSEANSQLKQIQSSKNFSKSDLLKIRDRALGKIGYGEQSVCYKSAKKAFNFFIREILS